MRSLKICRRIEQEHEKKRIKDDSTVLEVWKKSLEMRCLNYKCEYGVQTHACIHMHTYVHTEFMTGNCKKMRVCLCRVCICSYFCIDVNKIPNGNNLQEK